MGKKEVSNYGQQTTEEHTKSVFGISSYNLHTHQYNKMLSIYHDGNTNYVNIGMQNQGHEAITNTLGIVDLSNISLHIENPSKHLLQLTNNVRDPSINLHRNTGTLNKFWIIDGPTEDGHLVFKTSSSTASYIPDDNTTKTLFTITSNSIGLNVDTPVHAIDIVSENNMSSMRLTNAYSDYSLSESSKISEIKNRSLYYNYNDIELVQNVYSNNISYKIANSNIPVT